MANVLQQQPTPTQFQPVILPPSGRIIQTQDPKLRRQKYIAVLYGLGLTEIVLGVVFVIFGCINLGMYLQYNEGDLLNILAPATWCSVLLIASGALGIHTHRNCSACVYNANMVLSIISALMMSVLLGFSVLLTLITSSIASIVVNSLLSIGSFTALVVCIVHSAFCCAGICCGENYNSGQVYSAPQQTTQQYIQLANGQYVVVQDPLTAGCLTQNFVVNHSQETHHPAPYLHPLTEQTQHPLSGNHYVPVKAASTETPSPKFPVTFNE